MRLTLSALGPLSLHGDGWALFGRILLTREGHESFLPIAMDLYDDHFPVQIEDWVRVERHIEGNLETDMPGQPTPTPGWKTVPDFAVLVGVSERTIRNRIRARAFPEAVCIYQRGAQRLLWPEAVPSLSLKQKQPGRGELKTTGGSCGQSADSEEKKSRDRQGRAVLQHSMDGPHPEEAALNVPGLHHSSGSREEEADSGGTSALAKPRRIKLPRRR